MPGTGRLCTVRLRPSRLDTTINRVKRTTPLAPAQPVAPPRSTDPDDYQEVPRAVAAMVKRFADGHRIARHRHLRGQLLFSTVGVMSVTTDAGNWVAPPNRAVWMPPGVPHEVTMSGEVEMRTLYLRADVIRQESQQEFSGERARFSTSAFFEPEFSLGAQTITIRRKQVEREAELLAAEPTR